MAALSFKTVLEKFPSLFRVSAATRAYSQMPQALPSLLSTIKKANPQFTGQSDSRKRHYQLLQVRSSLGLIHKRWFTSQFMMPLQIREEFSYREREKQALTNILHKKPQFSIVSEPVNDGNASLLSKIIQTEAAKNSRPLLHLDLKERSFTSVNELASSLEVAKNLQLSTHSWLPKARAPIIFIDEANRMQALQKDEYDHRALTNMFEGFVKNTMKRFHVVLGTSDSFFHLWIAKYIEKSRFTSYVIGHLTKNEAERFWNEKVIPLIDFTKRKFSPPNFTDAYKVCGGCISFLEMYFSQYIQNEGKLQPKDFFWIHNARIPLFYSFLESGNREIWSREQLIEMIKKLVNAKNEFLVYEDLCNEMGKEIVDEFIKKNLLSLRCSTDFAYDMPQAPADKPILTATNPPSLLAMKEFIADIEKCSNYEEFIHKSFGGRSF